MPDVAEPISAGQDGRWTAEDVAQLGCHLPDRCHPRGADVERRQPSWQRRFKSSKHCGRDIGDMNEVAPLAAVPEDSPDARSEPWWGMAVARIQRRRLGDQHRNQIITAARAEWLEAPHQDHFVAAAPGSPSHDWHAGSCPRRKRCRVCGHVPQLAIRHRPAAETRTPCHSTFRVGHAERMPLTCSWSRAASRR
jgi:hypothetical protein